MVPRSTFLKAVALLALASAMPVAANDFDDMVNAEKAFAADASARNTKDAFLAALADDSVVFSPAPSNGKRVWEGRSMNKNRLEWTPETAEIATSGELGYTSGPWRFTAAGDEKPSAFGHYFTVWKKQPDGKWKVLVDHGVSHAETKFPDKVVRRGAIGVGRTPTWPVGVVELRTADLNPAGALNSRIVSADFLRLREGQVPDGAAEGTALRSAAARVDSGLVISEAGDLAATWGGGIGGPSWVRVWRRPSAEDAPGRGWVLAVDFGSPAPEPGN
jgi:ketosteroid isomerase-like protein